MFLKKNLGNLESIIRVLFGGIIIAAGIYFDSLWGLIGIIPVISGATSFCPIYQYMNIDKGTRIERAN